MSGAESQRLSDTYFAPKDVGDLNRMLYIDTKTWLPDDLLLKADKMTMANSLELRVPFLDHRLLEFGASLPPALKLKGFNMKYILKKTLSNRVPNLVLNRKKAGFPVPYVSWLRNELKDVVTSILMDSKTVSRGYFPPKMIWDLLKQNAASGKYAKEIFSLITLELWHRIFIEHENVMLN
jgi:asparagine synthase (glutamine-hydrolysing)